MRQRTRELVARKLMSPSERREAELSDLSDEFGRWLQQGKELLEKFESQLDERDMPTIERSKEVDQPE
jgi:hypothetical protein